MEHGLTKITVQIICGFRMMGLMPQKYPRVKGKRLMFLHAKSMRVRVSLDFDILIESFISLCIIETVGAIFREYIQ
jgi:hypothetical protein